MSEQAFTPERPRPSHVPFFIIVALVIILGLAIYFLMVRQREAAPLKLALVTWTQDPFWDPLIRGAQDCAANSNVKLTVIRSAPTVEAQNKHIHDLLAQGIDGIALSPNDPQAQLDLLNEVAAHVPLVTFDADAPESKRRRFVGIDNYAAGHTCADEMRDALPDGGPILISVGSATMLHGRDRRQGLIDGLLERGFDRDRAPEALNTELKGAKYTIVDTVTDGADPAKATQVIAEALRKHPEVKGIVGLFSYSAPAALVAMDQVGRAGQIQLVGFDESPQTQVAIESGAIHSSILQDSYRAGYESIEVLADEARGVPRGPAEQSAIVNVRINVLTAKNIDDMRAAKTIRDDNTAPTTMPATRPAS